MRLTEREMRRRVRAALQEADQRYSGWEGYAPRWNVTVPPSIMAALVKICQDVSDHIKQNYPPRSEPGYGFREPWDVDPQNEWAEEIKLAVKQDPVVERGLLVAVTLFRSLLPSELRSHVSTVQPSYEMTAARSYFLNTVAHAANVFSDNPEVWVKNLLSILALIWSGYTRRNNLV